MNKTIVSLISSLILCSTTYPMDTDQPQHNKYPLHEAARNCDLLKVTELLAAGSDANTQDEEGKTPLHHAVQPTYIFNTTAQRRNTYKEIAQQLLSQFARVNVADYNGYTPLCYCIQNENADMVRILLGHHATISTQECENFLGESHTCETQKGQEIAELLMLVRGLRLSRSLFARAMNVKIAGMRQLLLPMSIIKRICSYANSDVCLHDRALINQYSHAYLTEQRALISTDLSEIANFLFE